MKTLLFALLLAASAASAQNQEGDELVTVPKKFVSSAGITEAKAVETTSTVKNYVGIGKEVGTAFREGLGAITDETDRFAKTDPGKFTMFLIFFRMMGIQLVRMAFGIILAFVGTWIWVIAFRKNCLPQRYVRRENIGENGKVASRDYDIKEPHFAEGGQFAYALCLVGFVALCVAIGFA